jgi:hypothetical protein
MITQMFYIVLALLFAIHHLGLPKIFVVIGCLGWGEFLIEMMASHFPKRQLKPEPKSKSVDGEKVGTKVEKPNEIPAAIEQVETLQNNPESLNNQTGDNILTIESLSDEIPADNQELEAPEEPVSEPKDVPVGVRPTPKPSNQQLGMDEKQPKSLSEILAKIFDDIENVTNKDQQVLGENKLLEITEETIIPEEKSEQVEEQPSKDQSKTTDNQFRHQPEDQHALPPNPEKYDCEPGNQQRPKYIKIRVLRGENLPEAKDSYYVSMRGEEWHDKIHVQSKKMKTKIIRGSQPQWKENFTIKTQNPEKWMITIKLKKLSKWGLKTSITVGSGVIYVSELFAYQVNRVKLYNRNFYPVGKSCVDLEIKIEYPLPQVILNPKIISEPKETPVGVPRVPASHEKFETDEKKPEPKSPIICTDNLQQTINDDKNMTNTDAVGEKEDEETQKVEQQPASTEAESLPQQSTDGYQPTERNYMKNLFVNPCPAPNKTLLDILDMMLSSF